MKNVVCWDVARLSTILDPDALQISESQFLATHVRRTLHIVDPKNTRQSLGDIAPEDLLSQLLDPNATHVQDIVLGTSGAGKSRLVRWLSVHLPESTNRRVILVQKSGTNLKGVIEAVLDGMEGPVFDAYREKLRQAIAVVDPRSAPDELLNQIQNAVGRNSAFAHEIHGNEELQETRETLMEELPDLLGDPAFRKELCSKNAIIGELVRHALGREVAGSERERRVTSRAFEESHFNVGEWDVTDTDLNRHARGLFRKLRSSSQWRLDVADWINRNLDHAISRLLNFNRDDLGEMFLNVRRSLHTQGRDLVLLIEDFAKLQGVDFALLDAISVRPSNQPGGELCRLRSIMAMTTGYYQRIEQTFSGRIDLAVDVDSVDDTSQLDPLDDPDLHRIAAYHLNVLRVNESTVDDWSQQAKTAVLDGNLILPMLPNGCTSCEYKSKCHSAFGTVTSSDAEPIGLYPFTRSALREMYRRTGTEGALNPRVLLGRLLRQPLSNYSEQLKTGQWPPSALVHDFGRAEMPQPLVRQLVLQSSPELAPRYSSLIEIYGRADRLSGISPEIYNAFGLVPLRDSLTKSTTAEPFISPAVTEHLEYAPPRAQLSTVNQRRIEELNEWGNGNFIPHTLVSHLRELLYAHLNHRIDWNVAFLGQSRHTDSRGFAKISINFEAQNTRANSGGITLDIPRTYSIGLQGAVLFSEHQDWEFDVSGIYMVEFADMLDTLAMDVVSKLRSQNNQNPFDPVPAMVEVLAVCSLLCGDINDRNESTLVRKLLIDPVPTKKLSAYLAPSVQQLCDQLHADFALLRSLLLSQIACSKGQSGNTVSMLDAARIVLTVQKMTTSWKVDAKLPENAIGDYQTLASLLAKCRERLQQFIELEVNSLNKDLAHVNLQIGTVWNSQKTREQVIVASTKAQEVGVWRSIYGSNVENLTSAASNLRVTKLDALRNKASGDTLNDRRNILTVFSPELREEVTKGATFVTSADNFLHATHVQVEMEIGQLGSQGDEDHKSLSEIALGLTSILSNLRLVSEPSSEDNNVNL